MAPGKLETLVGRLEDVVSRLEELARRFEVEGRPDQSQELDKTIEKLLKEKHDSIWDAIDE
jgi:CAP N-terminal conserved motif